MSLFHPLPKAAQKTLAPKTTFREDKNVTPDSGGSAAKGKNLTLEPHPLAGRCPSSRETLAERVLLGSPVTRYHHWKESHST